MFAASFARFGIETRSANSARISRSWFERQARVCLAISAEPAWSTGLASNRNRTDAYFISRRDMLLHVRLPGVQCRTTSTVEQEIWDMRKHVPPRFCAREK